MNSKHLASDTPAEAGCAVRMLAVLLPLVCAGAQVGCGGAGHGATVDLREADGTLHPNPKPLHL